MTKTILVPIDGSTCSEKALAFACEYSAGIDAALYLLYVVQPIHEDHTLALGAAAITINDSREELRQAGKQVLAAAGELAAKNGGTISDSAVREGNPARVIVDTAKEMGVDMIIIGNRGLGDFAGMLMGSVSHKVNHLAPCTCITVR